LRGNKFCKERTALRTSVKHGVYPLPSFLIMASAS
jgi:hypothetical protein